MSQKSFKTLQDYAGYVTVRCEVVSIVGERRIRSVQTGRSFTSPVKRNFGPALERAKLQCFYKHVSQYHRSMQFVYQQYPRATIKVLDVFVRYEFDDDETLRREKYRGKYYMVLRKRGRFKSREKWSSSQIPKQ